MSRADAVASLLDALAGDDPLAARTSAFLECLRELIGAAGAELVLELAGDEVVLRSGEELGESQSTPVPGHGRITVPAAAHGPLVTLAGRLLSGELDRHGLARRSVHGQSVESAVAHQMRNRLMVLYCHDSPKIVQWAQHFMGLVETLRGLRGRAEVGILTWVTEFAQQIQELLSKRREGIHPVELAVDEQVRGRVLGPEQDVLRPLLLRNAFALREIADKTAVQLRVGRRDQDLRLELEVPCPDPRKLVGELDLAPPPGVEVDLGLPSGRAVLGFTLTSSPSVLVLTRERSEEWLAPLRQAGVAVRRCETLEEVIEVAAEPPTPAMVLCAHDHQGETKRLRRGFYFSDTPRLGQRCVQLDERGFPTRQYQPGPGEADLRKILAGEP